MTYIITEPCVGVKDAACVDVCPVDCIYTRDADDMYYINPDECIELRRLRARLPGDRHLRRGCRARDLEQLHRHELRLLQGQRPSTLQRK